MDPLANDIAVNASERKAPRNDPASFIVQHTATIPSAVTRPLENQLIKLFQLHGKSIWIHLIMAILAIIPISFAGFYSYQNTNQDMTESVLARRLDMSYLVATVLAEKLDRLVDVGVSLSTRVQFQRLVERKEWEGAIKFMESIPVTYSYIDRLVVTDSKGIIVADTPALPGVRGQDFSFRDWYQGVIRTGKPFISKIFKRRAEPQINIVAVAVPIKNREQALLGILMIQVKLESFFQWFRDAMPTPGSVIYIVDQSGQAVFHPQYTERGETAYLGNATAVQHALRGERGTLIIPDLDKNSERVTAFIPVEKYGWGVILEEPAVTAFAARDHQLQRFIVIYGLMLALSMFTAYLFFRAREEARIKTDLTRLVSERTSELEVANKELEAFSYSVSHDLRAPLRSIDGFSRILLDECGNKLNSEHGSHLYRIRAATQRMSKLIDDLLKLSRVTRAEMKRAPVDLSAITQSVIEELASIQPSRKVITVVQPGVTAVGDGPLLRVILENLLGNAWKFTSKIENAQIEFGAQIDEKQATVYFIKDNGAGFNMAYANKLFGAFQRLHGISEFPGTGIGLATVQRIVHRHGGEIWAESIIDQGATFYFTL